MSTLTELNALRVANGMNPLKAWKASKVALADAIKKLAAKSSTEVQVEASALVAQVEAAKKDDPKPAAKKQATKKAPAKPAKKVEGITLSTIAEKLDMNPKVARAKLRRSELEPKDGRWVFTEAQAAKITELLKTDARKK